MMNYLMSLALFFVSQHFNIPQNEQDERLITKSHRGAVPPEIGAKPEHWINSGRPLALGDLKGRVVLLVFTSVP